MKIFLLLTLLACTGVRAAPHHQRHEGPVLAPGYAELTFEAPAPGTYLLPSLGHARDAEVVDTEARVRRLSELMEDRFTLLGFIYTSCNDVNGCPLASYVLSRVQRRIAQDPVLSRHVRLLSLSFDRINDSPARMKAYGDGFSNGRHPDWQFLTTGSDDALRQILEDYDQFIIEDVNEAGEKVGSISHVLRVYLIDPERQIRNIYSVSFLHPDIIINDIRTLIGPASMTDVEDRRRRVSPGK